MPRDHVTNITRIQPTEGIAKGSIEVEEKVKEDLKKEEPRPIEAKKVIAKHIKKPITTKVIEGKQSNKVGGAITYDGDMPPFVVE